MRARWNRSSWVTEAGLNEGIVAENKGGDPGGPTGLPPASAVSFVPGTDRQRFVRALEPERQAHRGAAPAASDRGRRAPLDRGRSNPTATPDQGGRRLCRLPPPPRRPSWSPTASGEALARGVAGPLAAARSHVEPEQHHVAVGDDVLLALAPHRAGLARGDLAPEPVVVGELDGLGADEPLLEVGVDDARPLGAPSCRA